MANPKLNKTDTAALDEFGFEFSAPPEKASTRRSKHHERWEKARELCAKNPGAPLKVLEFNSASHAYNTAKAVNNGEHPNFRDDYSEWIAVGRQIEEGLYGLWLTYNATTE